MYDGTDYGLAAATIMYDTVNLLYRKIIATQQSNLFQVLDILSQRELSDRQNGR